MMSTRLTSRPPQAPLEAPPELRKPERLAFIDGLRGVAVLMVLVYHAWVHTIHAAIRVPLGAWRLDVTAPLHYGYLGVHLFLLLSGFCLTYPLARKGAAGLRVQLGRFFKRRAWRILPPYYAALFAFALMRTIVRSYQQHHGQPDVYAPVTPGDLIAHLLMVYNLFPAWLGTINGSFWSLALEWQLYLVFPLLVWGIRRWGLRPTLGAVLMLTVSYRTWVFLTKDTTRLDIAYFYAYSLPGRLFEFALGMAAAVALAQRRPERASGLAGRYLAAAAILAALGLTVTSRWSPYSPITDVIWGAAFYCLLMFAGSRAAAGRGWLEWPPLERLGLFSYSVYLIHQPLLAMAYALVKSRVHSATAALLMFEFGMVPLLIGLGWVFYRLVESRFLRTGKTPAKPAFRGAATGPSDRSYRLEELDLPSADRIRDGDLVRV